MCGVDKKRKKSIKMERIITSLLETDMYKFSMGQAIYHQFSDYKTTWSFKCRNTDVFFTKEMVDEIKRQIQLYCDLRFTEEELEYLHNIKWIKGSYVDFLRLWKARYEDFEISDDAECGLKIEARGTWLNTSMYEIPTLAIVNEVYFRMNDDYDKLLASFREKLDEKVRKSRPESITLELSVSLDLEEDFRLKLRSLQSRNLASASIRVQHLSEQVMYIWQGSIIWFRLELWRMSGSCVLDRVIISTILHIPTGMHWMHGLRSMEC